MHTKESLITQLADMRVPTDSVVLCHTSLRSVGEIDGGGETLLEALIEHCTSHGGLLCIPTHTWAFTDRPVTVDMSSSETCIGALPSLAAAAFASGDPRSHRSLHPTHSMVVFGDAAKAEDFIAGEVMVDTSTNPGGCYGKLYGRGGHILLIGVGLECNTYMHAVEEILEVPDRLKEDPVPMTIRLKSGDLIERPLRHHDSSLGNVSLNYPKYESAFRHHGIITDGRLGGAKSMLLPARGIFDVMKLVRERSGGEELLADANPLDVKYYE